MDTYLSSAKLITENFSLRTSFGLVVIDPSTGRQYVLCVPPGMQSCRQAAAWVAGFDEPEDYHPLVET